MMLSSMNVVGDLVWIWISKEVLRMIVFNLKVAFDQVRKQEIIGNQEKILHQLGPI